MNFDELVEGPFMWAAFLIFFISIAVRTAFYIFIILRSSKNKGSVFLGGSLAILRTFVPFHEAILKRPIYSISRYIFHLCLFAVPICLSGHVTLLEESEFEWSWTTMPDEWADGMSLLILVMITFFILRRLIVPGIRSRTSATDYILLVATALPYLSGYFLLHGTLDSFSFISNNIWTIHVASAEFLLIYAAFLTIGTRLDLKKCIGCSACTLSCPMGAIESVDWENERIFMYSRYECICCAKCVKTCPEEAAELRHGISFKGIFQVFTKWNIQRLKLKACTICGIMIAPIVQVDKVAIKVPEQDIDLCPRCRRAKLMKVVYHRDPGSLEAQKRAANL